MGETGLTTTKKKEKAKNLEKNSPWIWAILDGFLPILPPFITIISHPIAAAFNFQGILVLNLT